MDGTNTRILVQGRKNVEKMKSLALAGKGLNGFINKYVQSNFSTKQHL